MGFVCQSPKKLSVLFQYICTSLQARVNLHLLLKELLALRSLVIFTFCPFSYQTVQLLLKRLGLPGAPVGTEN